MRPMLACRVLALNSLPYPVFSSTKLDGIRCIIHNGVALSRTLKPIRNNYIQSILGKPEFNGLDGELIVGEPNAADCMRVTNSGVMSIEGKPDFTYFVFDIWDRPGIQYKDVLAKLQEIPKYPYVRAKYPYIQVLPQFICHNSSDVERHEEQALITGYEGLILRRFDGAYKFGRSTAREGYLFKLKRYEQEEAVVVGYEALQHNDNNPELNALGYTQRSSSQENKVDLPMLGALQVEGMYQDIKTTFNIGTGFTLAEREDLWCNRNTLIGKIVTYKFFPIGGKDRPRHPVFMSFRDSTDL